METQVIKNKSDMYLLYERGAFGNRLRTWANLTKFFESNYQGRVTLRYRGTAGGKWCAYEVKYEDIELVVSKWKTEGADRELVTLNESAPDNLLTIQGEVCETDRGLTLFYSQDKSKMRVALERGLEAVGMKAYEILNHYMSPSSRDDVDILLRQYPGAVVEFSTYKNCLGDCRGRNTIVWEVRHY